VCLKVLEEGNQSTIFWVVASRGVEAHLNCIINRFGWKRVRGSTDFGVSLRFKFVILLAARKDESRTLVSQSSSYACRGYMTNNL